VTQSTRSVTRATSQVLVGNMSMMVLQALQFFLLARVLGADSFGRVAAVNALLTLALPFTDLGFGSLMQVRTARDPLAAPRELGTAVVVSVVGGAVLIVVLYVVAPWIYDSDAVRTLVLLQGAAELIGFRLVTLCNQLYLAIENTSAAGLVNSLIAASRVVAIGCLVAYPDHGAIPWAIGTAVLSWGLAGVTLFRVVRRVGGFSPSLAHARDQSNHAVHFALSGIARSLFADTDKVLLGRYATPAALGVYVAAYRIVAMGLMPVRSLFQATSAASARSGAGGLDAALGVSHRLMRFALPFSLLAAVGLIAGAGLLPYLLGDSYRDAVDPLRILSAVLVVQTFQQAHTAALNGAGMQRAGARLQLVALAIYALLSFLVIPRYGALGAAVACVAGESLLALFVYFTVRYMRRSQEEASCAS
jgi:O-antigen/teichoic acid export membrane protein